MQGEEITMAEDRSFLEGAALRAMAVFSNFVDSP